MYGVRSLVGRPGPLPRATAIVVPHGSLNQAVLALQEHGALAPGPLILVAVRLSALLSRGDGAIHAGELAFPAHASIRDVLHVLRTGRPVQHDLTIPEGLTSAQIATLIDQAPALSGAISPPPEGSVLPETYAYALNTPRAELIERMQSAMRRKLAVIWDGRDPSVRLSSAADLLRLASIVERETAIARERPMVARVFLNRLRLGMKLQSDPTVVYAASGGLGVLPRSLGRADLLLPSPYNTYFVAGLPPGPICAPGVAALQAVAHPAVTDALYFVADGTGGHVFAADFASHLHNVAKLREHETLPNALP